jgi:hypothetical protein
MTPTYHFEKYAKLLRPVASLSRLFSDNDTPYLNSKFVERLYIMASGAEDKALDNSSFDAIAKSTIGVGVKTFVSAIKSTFKFEKIAEFTSDANVGAFDNLDEEQLIRKAIVLRNIRLGSDAKAYGIQVSNAIYHCLIRVTGAAMIHEEPMSLITESSLHPVDANGNPVKKTSTGLILSDGQHSYRYSKSKNVLYKRFPVNYDECVVAGTTIQLPINENIFKELSETAETNENLREAPTSPPSTGIYSRIEVKTPTKSLYLPSSILRDLIPPKKIEVKTRENYVILPLYSTRASSKVPEVQERSGINQWNARGRRRSFGEAYIPIPIWIHHTFPRFFPPRDQIFRLRLQDGKIVDAKVCQANGKALMTTRNDLICRWLYEAMEPDQSWNQITNRLAEERPYTYNDLRRINKDCVRITKATDATSDFSLAFAPLGSFEEFKQSHGT